MTNWKYTDQTKIVVARTLGDGRAESMLVSALDQSITPDPADPPSAEQIAAAQDAQDAAAAKQYAKLKALAQMTPTQVDNWVTANVNNLADAKDALKTLAIAVSVLARRL